TNVGIALTGQGKPAAAEAAYRKAIELKPELAEAHYNLGRTLSGQGRFGEAEAAYRKAIALKPAYPEAHTNLGNDLSRQGKPTAAEAAYRKAIELKPELAEAHYNLGIALAGQGRFGEAEAAYRKAIALKPDLDDAYYLLGTALMQRAQFQEAAAALKKASELLSEGTRGREQARQLWQQCQRFVILDARLPAVLRGAEKPASAAEQIEFARLCHFKKLHAAAAALYADAFATKPAWAEDPRTRLRSNAAGAAALAGCGRGEDGAEQGDAERARWRAQARQWLRADLDAWTKQLESGLGVDPALVHKMLARWRQDPNLAGLRDPD